jgi:uncharacterized protein YjhX (UPF0386 family)
MVSVFEGVDKNRTRVMQHLYRDWVIVSEVTLVLYIRISNKEMIESEDAAASRMLLTCFSSKIMHLRSVHETPLTLWTV